MWEETVMSDSLLKDIDKDGTRMGRRQLAKAQAEITGDIAYKAGKEEGKKYKQPVYDFARASYLRGIKEVVEEIERERFAEPQHIPQSGKEPVIICLTESWLENFKKEKGL